MHLTENCHVYTNIFFSAFWFALRIASVIVGGVFYPCLYNTRCSINSLIVCVCSHNFAVLYNVSIDSMQVNDSILLTFKPWHKSCWN